MGWLDRWKVRRNLCQRIDMEPDELRQRRDLYALAIGLLLFYAARGTIVPNATFNTVLPIHLKHPSLLLWAAWLGMCYFWFRFWLVSKGRPISDFKEDVRWQAGSSPGIRAIAAAYTIENSNGTVPENATQLLATDGFVPKLRFEGYFRTPQLSLQHIRRKRGDDGPATLGPHDVKIPPQHRVLFWRSFLWAIPKAAIGERTFTDYTLPHLFAIVTVVTALSVSVAGGHDATRPVISEVARKVGPPAAAASVTRSVPLVVPAAPSSSVQKSPLVSPEIAPQSAVIR